MPYDNIKSRKKPGFHALFRRYIFWKTTEGGRGGSNWLPPPSPVVLGLSALMKIQPIHHVIFDTTRLGFIQILHHCSSPWKIIHLLFLAQTSYTLNKKTPSNQNFQIFEWLGKNSQTSSCHIWNHKPVFLETLQCYERNFYVHF